MPSPSQLEQIQQPKAAPAPSRPWLTWLAFGAFSLLWLDLIRLLGTQWETREQYAYGWFVPFFAAALLWRRWLDRPGSEIRSQKSEVSGQWSVVSGPLLTAFVFLLLLLLLPLRVIYEINTDWPLIAWLYTLIVVALTLYAFHLAGPPSSPREMASWPVESVRYSTGSPISPGPHLAPRPSSPAPRPWSLVLGPWSLVSPWVRHFAFPVAFILVAVVWPYRIEKGLTQGLMRVVATLTVEILGWLDIPALQRGNLIDLGTGTVGIDEACSGIRSFQSTLMAGLLMGELYRLRLLPRAALVAIGLSLAFCFNVVRTLILSYQANKEGLSAIDKWHDPAGMTITVACFFCLWGLAVLIKKKTSDQGPETKVHGPQSTVHGPPTPLTSDLWRRFALAVGCWALVSIAATEAWYRSHANPNSGIFYWAAAMPTNNPTYQKNELPPRTLRLLSFDQGASGRWTEDGIEWSAHFFRWNPRSIQSVIQSRMHRPEVCLPASGFRQVGDSKAVLLDASGLRLPFRIYTYETEGRTLYVFFCQWEDGTEDQAGLQASKQAGRLQSVLTGRRHLGQQTLEVIITGCDSLESAKNLLQQKLPMLVVPAKAQQIQ